MTIVGVLAIQGAVEEHMKCVEIVGATSKEIRNPVDMENVDGIILPGGESTAMAIVGEKCGLFPALKDWVASRKPIWGTCAGMILLSDHAIKQKEGGQSLVGGLDVHVCRNYFGSQIFSSILPIDVKAPAGDGNDISDTSHSLCSTPCSGVFIRAPAILKVGKDVQVLATMLATPHPSVVDEVERLLVELNVNDDPMNPETDERDSGKFKVTVAVQQDNILATAFHPELTDDLRWHRYFLSMVEKE
mmetsp:Transcript_28931/g.39745  ORF Transcript_28931/g.39745 Transcript_28931/m.39745 type:complete len:246 (-) Transcript_28931:152-889(-)|eukprot:CAMPEP_0170078546 /NCGR_PEP_ID=MMETSP0019_2-20121128/15113_1 /TAXON_ID=98059 /ORGANISM="Dinobryon sp., Strain UTEXLB2267" /LENGTH=245 /DNA_ID=CAMNT_0010291483 /DNA_START=158 /DNA_END=895 /DNA_ORIENTATION=+